MSLLGPAQVLAASNRPRKAGEPLANRRWEKFAVFLAAGIPPYRAYPMAGYKPDEGNPYKLTGNYRVQERVKELIEEAFSKQDLETALTPEWIKSKLIEQASKADRPADRIRALELLAKYLPGMREADKTLSLEEEVRGLIESLGYGMAKAVLEERNMAHVMDTLEGEYSEAEPAKITEDVE